MASVPATETVAAHVLAAMDAAANPEPVVLVGSDAMAAAGGNGDGSDDLRWLRFALLDRAADLDPAIRRKVAYRVNVIFKRDEAGAVLRSWLAEYVGGES